MLQLLSDLFKDSGIGVSNMSIQLEKGKFISSIEPELTAAPFMVGGAL
jgi:hypothetical protein